ncbi:MAG TPA: DUF2288 domain-containing protein [Gammaproteobacteria bacterium]
MSNDDLRLRLNAETARIPWSELSVHFARGAVVKVAPALDLVEVAAAFVENRRDTVEAWMQAGQVTAATDADAQIWTDSEAILWAVVVAPWVLVQERPET